MSSFRQLEQMIEAELERYPGVSWHLETRDRSKHKRIVLEFNGQSRFVVIPNSPGCARGLRNKIGDIRRELNRMGATRRG
jgi:hypothetical protein